MEPVHVTPGFLRYPQQGCNGLRSRDLIGNPYAEQLEESLDRQKLQRMKELKFLIKKNIIY